MKPFALNLLTLSVTLLLLVALALPAKLGARPGASRAAVSSGPWPRPALGPRRAFGVYVDLVTRLSCTACGTEVTGAFTTCAFCSQDAADRALLEVFLLSRGNLKEVERALGVSYPTARARVDAMIDRLGVRLTSAGGWRRSRPSRAGRSTSTRRWPTRVRGG